MEPGEGPWEGPTALASATDVDAVTSAVLRELLVQPDARRAGLALVEGGGRRLRFRAATGAEAPTEWCHIDAYDDVPLTRVVRTGETIAGALDDLPDRYAGLVATQREAGTRALVAAPLPGASGPLGGVIVYYDRPQAFDSDQLGRLAAITRLAGDAVRRVRARTATTPDGAAVGATARHATLTLDDDPRAAGAARRFLRQTLAAWDVPDEVGETAELCLSELVTNAVIHAGAPSKMSVALDDGQLTVDVRDHGGPGAPDGPGGSGGPTPEPVDEDDLLRVFGRGLVLVDALSDRWGTDRDQVGTTSWFTLELPADAREQAG